MERWRLFGMSAMLTLDALSKLPFQSGALRVHKASQAAISVYRPSYWARYLWTHLGEVKAEFIWTKDFQKMKEVFCE
jgi:hypothetical protein